MTQVTDYIWFSVGTNEWQHGYYYADETGYLVGPYATQEAAQRSLDEYVAYLLG